MSYLDKVFEKWSQEDTILDTHIVAKLLLQNKTCETCACFMVSNMPTTHCLHPIEQKHVLRHKLTRGRGVCALWRE